MNRLTLLLTLLGWIAGTALQLQQRELSPVWHYVVLAGAAVLLAALPWRRVRAWRWALAAVCLAYACTGLRAGAFLDQALNPALEGQDIEVTGRVTAMPQRYESGLRFRFQIESAGQNVSLPPQVYLGWYRQESGPGSVIPEVIAGQRWRFTVKLKAPHGNSNPHGFDYELWLWEQGLQATGYVRTTNTSTAPQLLDTTWRDPVERSRQAVRSEIDVRMTNPSTAGITAALVVGDQSAIERSDWDIFRATGVAHLMSISGLHITMFAWLAVGLVGWLWRRSSRLCLWLPAASAAAVGGVLLAALYALFSGWGVPAQRTVCMLATVLLLRASARRWPWGYVWLLTMVVVLMFDPWAWMQPGFWLSFVAVGVLFATDKGQRAPSSWDWKHQLKSTAREQWVITCALAPLSLLLFQQFSVVGLLANALAIPWVTLVVTPLAMLGVLFHPLWVAAGWAIEALAVFLKILAAVPWATFSNAAPPLWVSLLGIFGGVWCVLPWPWRVRALGLPLVLPVIFWQGVRPMPGQFELLAVDVGQGNSVLVRTAQHSLLYDTGARFSADSDAGQRVLVPLLRAGDEKLNVVMVSHRDSDHSGGAPAVLAMQPQAQFISSMEAGHPWQQKHRFAPCLAGQSWQWDGVHFSVLHPSAADYETQRKPNALSCVLRISNGVQTALLVGDIERAQEQNLVQTQAPLRADVLLVPHHGSKTSSSESFLDAVAPRQAWVQAGYRNRFGHPAPPVVQRYQDRGIALVSTVNCGAIHWRSTQPKDWACQRELGRRYWHHEI